MCSFIFTQKLFFVFELEFFVIFEVLCLIFVPQLLLPPSSAYFPFDQHGKIISREELEKILAKEKAEELEVIK